MTYFPGFTPPIKSGHPRLQKNGARIWPHNKPSLLSPVITEIDSVNIVFQSQIDHRKIVITDAVK